MLCFLFKITLNCVTWFQKNIELLLTYSHTSLKKKYNKDGKTPRDIAKIDENISLRSTEVFARDYFDIWFTEFSVI